MHTCSNVNTQMKECLDKIDSLLAQFKIDKSRLLSAASDRRPPWTGYVPTSSTMKHAASFLVLLVCSSEKNASRT